LTFELESGRQLRTEEIIMSNKLNLLLLVLETMLLASCWPFEILPTAGNHDDHHHNVPGWYAASERWDVSVSSGSKLRGADTVWLEFC
jgi:hypothetical protein